MLKLKAKANLNVKFRIRLEVGNEAQPPDQAVIDRINELLEGVKDGFGLKNRECQVDTAICVAMIKISRRVPTWGKKLLSARRVPNSLRETSSKAGPSRSISDWGCREIGPILTSRDRGCGLHT